MTNAEIIATSTARTDAARDELARHLDDARADELAQLLPTAANGPLRREIERRVYLFARRKATTAPA